MGVYEKIALVMGDIHGVEKKGFNDFHKYHYTRAEDVADAIRPAMARHKLCVIPTVIEQTREIKLKKDNYGKEKEEINSIVKMQYQLVDGESSEKTEPVIFYGEGNDSGDKSLYKAMTAAEKYFLLQTFLIASGEDDPEAEPEENKKPQDKPKDNKPVEQRLDDLVGKKNEKVNQSPEKVNEAYEIGKKKGFSEAQVDMWCRGTYKVAKVTELTDEQYTALVNKLSSMPDK